MKVLVIGATGGSGRAAIEHLLGLGHQVTAFARRADPTTRPGLRWVVGDIMSAQDVDRAVAGHDAVVVTVGIRENPLRVRVLGPSGTPLHVRSAGTRLVIAAMKTHGVRRLVVQTSYGVGATRDRLRIIDRLLFALVLRPQIADTELQEADVTASGLDWVVVQPVHLTDADDDRAPQVTSDGTVGTSTVSRRSVGRVLAQAVSDPALVRRSLAVSGG